MPFRNTWAHSLFQVCKIHVAQSSVFCVVFRRTVCPFVFFFLPLYCIFFDLRLLITLFGISNILFIYPLFVLYTFFLHHYLRLVIQRYKITLIPSGEPEFTPDFSGIRVARSLLFCVIFVDSCLSFCPFSFGHCVVCPSSIYGF